MPAFYRIILFRRPGISLTDFINVFGKEGRPIALWSSDSSAGSFVGGRVLTIIQASGI